ncbi:hypothetical protein PILCRDRAFT_188859 [Piloderma croceum F 1598]|uniref:Uncharacterized protein n=1 Tax=Piloderma croceum (strain F 1598) TaxID=765440 RepID=A0A0C3BVR0_PILCF|nr:hypothetical protein PILCRDRAFT_188859 [Piloderma croceum F 1598]
MSLSDTADSISESLVLTFSLYATLSMIVASSFDSLRGCVNLSASPVVWVWFFSWVYSGGMAMAKVSQTRWCSSPNINVNLKHPVES